MVCLNVGCSESSWIYHHHNSSVFFCNVSSLKFTGPLPYTCSFETSDLCGMHQRANDQFDWKRQTGGTDTNQTGPSGAVDGTYYIYTEASDPRIPGDKAMWDMGRKWLIPWRMNYANDVSSTKYVMQMQSIIGVFTLQEISLLLSFMLLCSILLIDKTWTFVN